MYTLTLYDGTTLQTSGAGAADRNLWIYGLSESFAELVGIFSDPSRLQTIRVHYQESLPDAVFEGYTTLRAVMTDDEGQKVCLRKEAAV